MPGARPNIVLITADSLRADRLGCYGYGRSTTPTLDEFATESHLFLKAFAAGPNTPHAFPAMMAGRSSMLSKRLGLFDDDITLAERLKANGYATVGFNAANPYVSRLFRYDRGFENFCDFIEFDLSGRNQRSPKSGHNGVSIPELDLNHYLVSESAVRRKAMLENRINGEIFEALEILAQPFFLWVHYMDPHYPYVPQPESQHALGFEPITKEENLSLNVRVRENLEVTPNQFDHIGQLYDASVRQLDTKVNEVFAFLKHKNLYDDAIILFAADHGEEFLEHGGLQHKSKLYDELLNVPLFIKLPRQKKGAVHHRMRSMLHLPSTVLSAAGITNPFVLPSIFSSLHESKMDTTVFAEASYLGDDTPPVDNSMYNIDPLAKRACLRTRQWKLILDSGSANLVLFNLLDDPYESRPLRPEHVSVAEKLITVLQRRIYALERSRVRRQASLIRKKMISQQDDLLSFGKIVLKF